MSNPKKRSNVRFAGLFVMLVLVLICFSFFIKFISILKNSKFDAKHEFNIAVVSKNSTELVSLSPSTRSILILNLEKKINPQEISKTLEIPIDAQINSNKSLTKNNVSSILFSLVLPFSTKFENMTYADALRIFLFSRDVLPSSVYYRTLMADFNQQQTDTVISLTFTDPTIYKENQSIEIVNATDVYGLGTRLAKLITNIGGNVILVTSSQKQSSKSKIIYSGNKSYSVERLSKILNYPITKTDKSAISDVIIIIGNDTKDNISF